MAFDDDNSPNIVVLISGSGSNLQALIDADSAGTLGGTIALVVSNRADAYGLVRARRANIDTVVLEPASDESRRDYDARLADAVDAAAPKLIVLAGWMRLLSSAFLDRFPNRVINLHPALPGQYPGLHAIERAFADAQAGHIDHTGVMVHYVPDEGVDDGPVIATATVAVDDDDTLDSLAERVHACEHQLLVGAVAALLRGAFPSTMSIATQ